MNPLLIAAADQRSKSSGFIPAAYRYAGTVVIGYIPAGGAEYGYLKSYNAGSITPSTLDTRAITRASVPLGKTSNSMRLLRANCS